MTSHGSDSERERLLHLVAQALERLEDGGEEALAAYLAQHPQEAAHVERRVAALAAARLLGPPGRAEEFLSVAFGEFQPVDVIGEGGMGIVYRALQAGTGREVALKLIRPDLLPFARSRERFGREVRAAARLSHEGIVPILSAGEERGLPWLAMELVEGGTLDDALARRRASRSRCAGAISPPASRAAGKRPASPWRSPSRARSSTPTRTASCTATSSPRTSRWTPEVARASSILGWRRRKASDESPAAGRSSDRSPTWPPSRCAARRIGSTRAPTCTRWGSRSTSSSRCACPTTSPPGRARASASLRAARLRCARATRLSPGRRKPCASPRWRPSPATATPTPDASPRTSSASPRTARRALRWARRHPGASAAIALAVLLLVGAPLGFGIQQRRTRVAVAAERNRARAEAELTRRMYDVVVRSLFLVDPHVARGEEPSLRDLVDASSRVAAETFTDHPELHVTFLEDLGNLAIRLSEYDRAQVLLEEAVAIRRRELPLARAELASCLKALGWTEHLRANYARAEELLREALAIRRELARGDDADLAACLNNLAEALRMRGDYAESEELYRQSLDMYRRLFGPRNTSAAMVACNLAAQELLTGDYAVAEELYRESLSVREALLGEVHPDTWMSLHGLANVAVYRKDAATAEPWARRALEVARKLHSGDHADLAEALGMMAEVSLMKGEPAAAEELYREALGICERIYGPTHPQVAFRLDKLGLVLEQQGRVAEAEEMVRASLEIVRATYGDRHDFTATGLNYLAGLLERAGKLAEALELHRESLAVYRAALAEEHPNVTRAMGCVAWVLHRLGRYAEAEPLARELIERRRAEGSSFWTAWSESLLGSCLAERGAFADAGPLLGSSLRTLEQERGPDDGWTKVARARVTRLEELRATAEDAPPSGTHGR